VWGRQVRKEGNNNRFVSKLQSMELCPASRMS
jgi:hypothetical protein